MLFMLVVKGSKSSEEERPPNPELEEAMDQYNRDLVQAGVRVMAKGLQSSSNGMRLSFPEPGGKPVVTYGPFPEAELIAGFILIDVKSREEAIQWALRMPDPIGYGEGQIELRQLFE